jgi:hypothetical protein
MQNLKGLMNGNCKTDVTDYWHLDFTHPVIASLDHPLFAARKKGFYFFLTLFAKQRGPTSVA